MRIISRFKDYYDGCQSYGSDPNLVYVRKTREITIERERMGEVKQRELKEAIIDVSTKIKRIGYYDPHIDPGAIAFCGKIYPFWRYNGSIYYDYARLRTAVIGSSKDRRLLHSIKYHEPSEFYDLYNQEVDVTPFNYLKSPIFLIEEIEYIRYLVVNPSLRNYDFATQVHPYTAYQEISMYLGNDMANQMDPEIGISDKLRAESHGFDKWSFRKHKDDNKKT